MARIRGRNFGLDRVDLGVRDLVSEAITDTLSGLRRWRRDVTLIQHLSMTMKSIASRRREKSRAAAGAGFEVERRGDMMPGLQAQGEDGHAGERPVAPALAQESEAERIIAADRIRAIRRQFADDPAALAVIDGWLLGKNGKEIQEESGLTLLQFQAAARRVRRFAARQGDDVDGG